jgi:hypothetical protein
LSPWRAGRSTRCSTWAPRPERSPPCASGLRASRACSAIASRTRRSSASCRRWASRSLATRVSTTPYGPRWCPRGGTT